MAPKTATKERSKNAADESRRIRIQDALGKYLIVYSTK
jgi:hypothetical protein